MIKLFTHNDLDGIGCTVLARLTFSENVDITYCDYDEVDTLVREYITKMTKVMIHVLLQTLVLRMIWLL